MKKITIDKCKIKEIIVPLIQLLVIAGIIGGVIYYALSKLPGNAENDYANDSNIDNVNDSQSDIDDNDEKAFDMGGYQIVVSTEKKVVVVYQYSADNDEKEAVKVFNCLLGKNVTTGSYKIYDKYSWTGAEEGSWNQYNSRFGTSCFIQSVDYSAPYSYYLNTDSYNSIGMQNGENSSIKLQVADAKWIYDNCPVGTKIKIKKGKSIKLPYEPETIEKLPSYAGWDPTDPAKGNPWNDVKNGEISSTSKTVYVERGTEINYLANVIAMSPKGKNITKKLSYTVIDNVNIVGKYTVKYTYETSAGVKYKATVKYKIVDTKAPLITLSEDEEDYNFEVNYKKKSKINTEEIKDKLVSKVKNIVTAVDVNETISKNNMQVFLPETLKIGKNAVKVEVADNYGNTSVTAVTINIIYKENTKETQTTKKKQEETTTKKKQKKTTTKKNSETKATTKEEVTEVTTETENTTNMETVTEEETTNSEIETESSTTEQSAGDI